MVEAPTLFRTPKKSTYLLAYRDAIGVQTHPLRERRLHEQRKNRSNRVNCSGKGNAGGHFEHETDERLLRFFVERSCALERKVRETEGLN